MNKEEFIVELKVIKEHLDARRDIHPLRTLLREFSFTFIRNYKHLLYEDQSKVFQTHSSNIEACIGNLLEFRQVMQDAIVRFFRLDFTGPEDPNIQLLQNMVTNLILSAPESQQAGEPTIEEHAAQVQLHVFVKCLYTAANVDQIQQLHELMSALDQGGSDEHGFGLANLGCKQQFRMNLAEDTTRIVKHIIRELDQSA